MNIQLTLTAKSSQLRNTKIIIIIIKGECKRKREERQTNYSLIDL